MKGTTELITALTEFKKTLIKSADPLEAINYKAMKDTIDKKIMELIVHTECAVKVEKLINEQI